MDRSTDDELLTTGEAAKMLGSTRQHVADLCDSGRLTCVRAGTHRRVPRSAVEAVRNRTERLTREEQRSLWLGHAVAGRLVRDPAEVLDHARNNLIHMQAVHPRGQASQWLKQWEKLLDGPVDGVLDVLTSRSPQARELRQNSPFAGVLDQEERMVVLRASRSVTDSLV